MTTAVTDTFTLERPEDVSDGRWQTIQSMAHKMVTGHMPWCEDHRGTEDGDKGWCTATIRTMSADAEIHNCSNDGRILLDLNVHDEVDLSEMTVPQALAISAAIDMAANLARGLTPDHEEAQA